LCWFAFPTWCKKKEQLHPGLEEDIKRIVDSESQIDPKFKTERCYVKVSAAYVYKELVLSYGYGLDDFRVRTVNNILNRLGYTLKKVLKTKPLKKIPETDAIFANVSEKHEKATSDKRILSVSMDVKAKVKIGNLSRGGYSRTIGAPKADDHDQHWTDVLVPFGLHEVNTDNTFVIFGNSRETPDFIVDCLEKWWTERQFMMDDYDMLMIDLDNGKSVAGNTRQFLKRMSAFSEKIGMPIQMVYYPPYHSKYNLVERFWAALENYWSPLILDTVANTIDIAKKVTWKGMNPIVSFIDKKYEKGIKVSKQELEKIEKGIRRNPNLKKWDFIFDYNSG